MKKIIIASLLACPLLLNAQHYKTRTISQYGYDDSNKVLLVCTEHYNEKGKIVSKVYSNSTNAIDPEEEGDDKGTTVIYIYKDSLLMSEKTYRTQEYEDTAITEHNYNEKGIRLKTLIQRHDRFGSPHTGPLDTNYAENPTNGEMKMVVKKSAEWKWLSDTITYQYNGAGQMIAQRGGEKWHKTSYNGSGLAARDTTYSSPADLKAKSYIVINSQYSKDKELTKKTRDYYNKGNKYLDRTVEYTYANGKLIKMHSTATTYSKKKSDDAKFENLRFDKKYYYDKEGRLIREETWDPEGFKLVTNLYSYK